MNITYREDILLREVKLIENNYLKLVYHDNLVQKTHRKKILTYGIVFGVVALIVLISSIGLMVSSKGMIVSYIALPIIAALYFCIMTPIWIIWFKVPITQTRDDNINKEDFLIVSYYEHNGRAAGFSIRTTANKEFILLFNMLAPDIISFLKKEAIITRGGDTIINNTIINKKRDRLELKEMMIDGVHLHNAGILDKKEYKKHKEKVIAAMDD